MISVSLHFLLPLAANDNFYRSFFKWLAKKYFLIDCKKLEKTKPLDLKKKKSEAWLACSTSTHRLVLSSGVELFSVWTSMCPLLCRTVQTGCSVDGAAGHRFLHAQGK